MASATLAASAGWWWPNCKPDPCPELCRLVIEGPRTPRTFHAARDATSGIASNAGTQFMIFAVAVKIVRQPSHGRQVSLRQFPCLPFSISSAPPDCRRRNLRIRLLIPTSASLTWRSPHSRRNWRVASTTSIQPRHMRFGEQTAISVERQLPPNSIRPFWTQLPASPALQKPNASSSAAAQYE